MFCHQCGANNPDGTAFCSACGTNLNAAGQPNIQTMNPNPYGAAQPAYGYGIQPVRAAKGPLNFIACAVIIIGCFLPFLGTWGINVNYVYNYGQPGDGIFLIGFCIIQLIVYACSKRLKAPKVTGIIFSIICLAIFIYDLTNAFSMGYGRVLSIGAYTVGAGIIFLFIDSIRLKTV